MWLQFCIEKIHNKVIFYFILLDYAFYSVIYVLCWVKGLLGVTHDPRHRVASQGVILGRYTNQLFARVDTIKLETSSLIDGLAISV